MKYNPDALLMEAFREQGLNIVDKRGIKFENEAERNMLWEGRVLVDNFRWYLSCLEEGNGGLSDADYEKAMKAFMEDIAY